MSLFSCADAISESAVVVTLPADDREVSGRLRFDPDEGITVHLLLKLDLAKAIEIQGQRYAFLRGTLLGGGKVTLVECTVESANTGMNGIVEVRLVASYLLVGYHMSDPNVMPFLEMRVVLSGLARWFNQSPFEMSVEDLEPPGIGQLAVVKCRHVPRVGFSPINGGPSLYSDQLISSAYKPFDSASIANQFAFYVRPRSAFGLDDCISEPSRLQAFISLLCGHQVYVEQVRLYLRESELSVQGNHGVGFLAKFARPRHKLREFRPEVVCPLPMVADVLPEMWCAWTSHYRKYQSSVELFASTEMFGEQMLEFQMLAIMQALETLHRNRFDGVYVPAEAYSAIEVSVNKAIPAMTPQDLRSALVAKMKYGNEYSLRKRLNQLAGGLPGGVSGEAGRAIHPVLGEFLGKAVDTRNYLTHYTGELKTAAFREAQLYWATRVLRWFFTAVVLSDLGLPERSLAQALANATELRHARENLIKTRPSNHSAPATGVH